MKHSTYLGDGVYAQVDADGSVVLSTGNHIADDQPKPDNVVVLEPAVLVSFTNWLKGIQ